MKRWTSVVFFIVIGFFTLCGQTNDWSEKLTKKVEKTLTKTFGQENTTFELNRIKELDSSKNEDLNHHLFRVLSKGDFLGYAYVNEAPSMKKKFDYIIVFSPDFQIKKCKILIYREQHGRQIGHPRWLRQFVGMSPQNYAQVVDKVDAISGATISSDSMTLAVHKVLMAINNWQNSSAANN